MPRTKEQRAEYRKAHLKENAEYQRVHDAERYRRDPEFRRKRIEGAKKHRAEVRTWVNAYKISVGCCDCGFKKEAVALQFDHVSGKKTLAIATCRSVKKVKEEITKCVVRCANCHLIRHWRRLQHANAE